MQVLPLGRFRCEKAAECSAILSGRFAPIFLDGVPTLAESFFVRIAVLGNDGGDPFWVRQGKTKSHWRAVIEYVDRVALETDCLGEAVDGFGQLLKCVAKLLAAGPSENPKPGRSGATT